MGRACPDELCHYTHPVYSLNSGVPLLEEHIWFHWSSTALQCAVLHLASCYSLKIYIILQLYWPVGIPKFKHLALKNRHDVGTWDTLSVMVGEKAEAQNLTYAGGLGRTSASGLHSEPNSWKITGRNQMTRHIHCFSKHCIIDCPSDFILPDLTQNVNVAIQ